jgi:hypothetical protein
MNIEELISNWHEKISINDCFSKFMFEYLAFIALLKKKKYPNVRSDREAIQKLKRDEKIKNIYLEYVKKDHVLNAWNNIINELGIVKMGNISRNGNGVEEIEYWNCSRNHFSQKTKEDKSKKTGIIHNLQDWENMIEFLYSIRNNLFHGGKNPQDTRDQLLIENGYLALNLLVEVLIRPSFIKR